MTSHNKSAVYSYLNTTLFTKSFILSTHIVLGSRHKRLSTKEYAIVNESIQGTTSYNSTPFFSGSIIDSASITPAVKKFCLWLVNRKSYSPPSLNAD